MVKIRFIYALNITLNTPWKLRYIINKILYAMELLLKKLITPWKHVPRIYLVDRPLGGGVSCIKDTYYLMLKTCKISLKVVY